MPLAVTAKKDLAMLEKDVQDIRNKLEVRRVLYEQFLRCVDREENLIHYRMTWGLQCNIALLAALFATQNYLNMSDNLKALIEIIIAVFGGVASFLSSEGVKAAHQQTDYLKTQLSARLEIKNDDEEWVRTEFLRPFGGSRIHRMARYISAYLPGLFILFWVLVFFYGYHPFWTISSPTAPAGGGTTQTSRPH